jgi:hypothetical protein
MATLLDWTLSRRGNNAAEDGSGTVGNAQVQGERARLGEPDLADLLIPCTCLSGPPDFAGLVSRENYLLKKSTEERREL